MALRITRRRFLTGTAAGGIAVLVPGQAVAFAEDSVESDVRVGVLAGTDGDTFRLVSQRDRVTQVISTGPDTAITRGGRAELGEFEVGEELIAFGQADDRLFRADRVDRLFRAFNGTVDVLSGAAVSVAGTTLTVTGSTIVVDPQDNGAAVPLHEVDGRPVHVLAWYRPAKRDLAAAVIYLS